MLLRTRFYIPPLRANNVVRDGLLTRLRAVDGGSLVLITAPAGYGKTTLVSQWLHHHPHTFAWITLGPEHNLLNEFWQYFIAGLRQCIPDAGNKAEAIALSSPLPDYEQMLVAVLNDLDQFSINNRSTEPVTLVLDDFHHIQNSRLLGLLNLFLDHLPPCLRLVITARREPELKLSRRRASGQLLQFGVDDLRFNNVEAQQFFAGVIGLSGQNPLAQQLCERAEGWIAGLQLAAITLQRDYSHVDSLLSQQGLNRHVADYLFDEVFSHLSGTLQYFLIASAAVERFCAGLCNALTQRTNSLTTLLELEAQNLFLVPLDNHRTWYRYHDLFRQFLRERFKQLPPHEQREYLARAIDWFEQNGYWIELIGLYRESQQWEALLRLLELDAVQLIVTNDPARLQQWLEQVPSELLTHHPVLQARISNESGQTAEIFAVENELIEPLTQQEKLVLDLIGQGLPNKVIAAQLKISLNTLKVHIRNLYGKMGVENRTQALLRLKH